MKHATLRNNFLTACLFILFLAFTSCEEPAASPATSPVSGVIVDELDNAVQGAFVEALNSSNSVVDTSTTNELGAFSLSKLTEDLSGYNLRVTHSAYKPFISKLSDLVKDKDRKNVPVKLMFDDSCCGRIEVVIRNQSDSTVISGAQVRLNREQTVVGQANTNDDGRVNFDPVCPGSYWIRIAKEGFRVIEQAVQISECDTVRVTYYMQQLQQDTCCDGVIIFTAKNSENTPQSNVTVRLWKGNQMLSEQRTNQEGKYIFRELCKGGYAISYSKEGYKSAEFVVTVDCGDTVVCNKTLVSPGTDSCCDGRIKIKVQDSATAAALNGAIVRLWKGSQNIATKTVENGYVVFEKICKGTYGLSITKDGYKSIEFQVELGCNETKAMEKPMTRIQTDSCCDGRIKVKVQDLANGAALNGATVRLWKANQNIATKSVENGYVVFEKICQGTYGVDIMKDGYKSIEFQVVVGCNETKATEKSLARIETDSCCDGRIIAYALDSANGSKLANATVKLRKGAQIIETKTTDANGRVAFEKVCRGSYNIVIIREGYKSIEFEFNIECNATLEFHKKLLASTPQECCTAILKLRIIDNATEAYIENARVEVILDNQIIRDPRSNAEGWAKAEQLCAPKTYRIRVIKDGYQTKEFEITFTECNTKQETVRLLQE